MKSLEKKVCKACNRELPATSDYFSPKKSCRMGLMNSCKPCRAAESRKWREDNPNYMSAYNAANHEVRLAQSRAYNDTNRELKRQKNYKRYWEDPEKGRQKQREWKANHPDAARDYYERNKERHAEQMARWRASHKEAQRAFTAAYRARKRESGGEYTADDVFAQYNLQSGLCYWCSTKLDGKYEVDHFFPVSRGGSNGPDNIVIACKRCNRTKHAKAPEDFIWELAEAREPRFRPPYLGSKY